ncbi:hypothetical protein HMPREF1395_00931 [Helicobacter pylori GAM112Ai]|nr:hypothetical protein HMPREF1395_00931 [Helicobacter pylori GAM112Ai]EMG90869.1 hypothetical protein HMPREF1403_00683 [Helicobacter pylori GAM201Ai]EMH32075.1 hypothetical protein HMPREF1424_01343 [Helicobacter pylori GAM42Ai]
MILALYFGSYKTLKNKNFLNTNHILKTKQYGFFKDFYSKNTYVLVTEFMP